MLENLTEEHQLKEFRFIAPYLTGKEEFPKKRFIPGVAKWFKALGYKVVEPYQKSESVNAERHTVCEFFKEQKTFGLATADLIDSFLLYVEEEVRGPGLQFAAALVVFQVCDVFLVMVTSIKVREERLRTGLGATFFGDVAQYIFEQTEGKLYHSSYMVVQQYQRLNPHGFYKKLGFVDAPSTLESWKMPGSDLAVCSLDQFYASHVYQKLANNKKASKEDAKSEDDEELNIPSYSPVSATESAHTSKSQSRRDKHCHYGECGGKLHKGLNWARHLKKVHDVKGKPADSMYTLCDGDECIACIKFEEVKIPKEKGKTPTKGYIKCTVCNTPKRQDTIGQKKPVVICKACINKEKGLVRGKKRTHTTALSECRDMIKPQVLVVQEIEQFYTEEQEVLNKYDTPSKRANTNMSFVSPIPYNGNSTVADTTDMRMQIDTTLQSKALSSVSQEPSGLTTLSNALQITYRSKGDILIDVENILTVCALFIHDYAEKCIQTNKCTQLIDCINKLLDRIKSLPLDDMVGLLAAAFIIGQSCWQSAVSALNITTKENRDSLIQKFSLHIATTYDYHAAKWFEQYWKYSTDHQIEICKYFKTSGQEVTPDILTLSLVVQKSNIRDFIQFAQLSLDRMRDDVCTMLDHIQKRPAQPSLAICDMRMLLDVLSSTKNQQAVLNQQEQLKTAAIVQWMEILDAATTTVNVADAESIQDSLDELQRVHGALTELKEDITQSEDSLFGAILDSIEVKPNKKQFALAQYCVADLYTNQRQLWVVPSGQGKARIAAAIAMISLLSGQSEKIYMVFPNEHLQKRDQAEFEPLISVSSMEEEKVEYRVGLKDFNPVPNALIIVDEIDIFLLDQPIEFKAVVAANACIGLTATTAGTQMEKQVAKALEFKERFYSFGDSEAIANAEKHMVDETIKAQSVDDKVAYIQQIAKSNPVLVYCSAELTNALTVANVQPVLITEDIDYERLRTLDQMVKETGLYTVIVSQDTMGMRGIDYRCKMLKLTLVIAQSFDNKRDATQAFNRVGRFGDSYCRVRFDDVDIINKKKEVAQLVKHTMLVGKLGKPDVAKLQPIVVNKVTTRYKGKNPLRQTQLLSRNK